MISDNFEKFDSENPKVYELFEKFAFDAIKAGRKHFGVAMIAERLRWYSSVETSGDKFKINNNYKAFYARKFEKKNPQYKGFFRNRTSLADINYK